MYKYLVVIFSLLVVVGCAFQGKSDTSSNLTNPTPTDISDTTDWNNNSDNSDSNLNADDKDDDEFVTDDTDSDGTDAAGTGDTPVETPITEDRVITVQYAQQEFNHFVTIGSADPSVSKLPNPCGTSLQITMKSTTYPDTPFGDADVNNGFSMMGNGFEATFQATGGVPPYSWELISSAANFWGIPSTWTTHQSTEIADNDTFNIDGIFDLALRLCPAYPAPTIIDTDGTATFTPPEMVPTYFFCAGSESIEEVLTVKVTDQCTAAPQTKEKSFHFDLNRTHDKVSDLIGVELVIDFDDTEEDSPYVEVELYTHNEETGRDELVAKTPRAWASRWGDDGHVVILSKIYPVEGKGGVALKDVHRVAMWIDQKVDASGPCFMSACYLFDVHIDYVGVFSPHWMWWRDDSSDIEWQVPGHREKRENFTTDAKWQRGHQYFPESSYGLVDNEWIRWTPPDL